MSSATLWWATRAVKAGQTNQGIVGLALTLVLGIGFTVTQAEGWKDLASLGMGWNTSDTATGHGFPLEQPRGSLRKQCGVRRRLRFPLRRASPLLHDAARGELYAPDDALMVQPITTKVLQSSNSGGGYIWALVMVHILHLVFGLIYLVVNGIRIFTGVIHQGDTVRLKATGIYWHFLGLLWIYLFAFLFLLH